MSTEEVQLFADDMLLHIQNPREFTPKKKILKLISKFSRVAGYTMNTGKYS